MGLPIFALAIWLSYVILKRDGIAVPEVFGRARGPGRRRP
jgi:hypothetical protein